MTDIDNPPIFTSIPNMQALCNKHGMASMPLKSKITIIYEAGGFQTGTLQEWHIFRNQTPPESNFMATYKPNNYVEPPVEKSHLRFYINNQQKKMRKVYFDEIRLIIFSALPDGWTLCKCGKYYTQTGKQVCGVCSGK